MKVFTMLLFIIVSMVAFAEETKSCSNLDCIDEIDKDNNIMVYLNVLWGSLEKAKGCKDLNKLDKALEYTTKITHGVASQEAISEFIEEEFMNNPKCILSRMQKISKAARIKVADYLSGPTFVHWKNIEKTLNENKKDYPNEYHLILTGKELEK